MASALFFLPFKPAFTSRGLPAGAASVTFYASGTTTKQAVFYDDALTQQAPNPVSADALGRFPTLYMNTDLIYRVRVRDALGGLIGEDVDPYFPGTLDGLMGETGPANSTYTTLATLKAAPATNRSYNFAPDATDTSGFPQAVYYYTPGDFSAASYAPQFESGALVKLTAVDLTVGVLSQQDAVGVKLTDLRPRGVPLNLKYKAGMTIDASDWGVVGDGETINDAAWAKLLLDCIDGNMSPRLGPGKHLFHDSGALSQVPRADDGLCVRGHGRARTQVLLVDPGTTERWLYDATDAGLAYTTWEDISFGCASSDLNNILGINPNANGFRFNSSGPQQNATFVRCGNQGFNVGFDFIGTNTASEIDHIACEYGYAKSAFYRIRNRQSFNHRFFGTSTLVANTLFSCEVDDDGNAGGGAIMVYGGNIIMLSDASNPASFSVLDINSTTGIGATPNVIHGTRIEFRPDAAKLLRFQDLIECYLNTESCQFQLQTTTTSPNWAALGAFSTWRDRDSNFNAVNGGAYDIRAVGSGYGRANNGIIDIEGATVPPQFADMCTSVGYGYLSGRNLKSKEYGYVGNTTPLAALDFTKGSPPLNGSNGVTVKAEMFTPKNREWPGGSADPTADEIVIKLPLGFRLDGLVIDKPAGGLSQANVSWLVGSNDKSIIYGQTDAAPASSRQLKRLNDLGLVLDTENKRTVRCWISAASGEVYNRGGRITLISEQSI